MPKINITRKQMLLIALVLALGTAIILNWRFSLAPTMSASSAVKAVSATSSKKSQSSSSGSTASSYFAAARLTRQQTNAQAEDLLNSLLSDSPVTASEQQSVQSAITAFNSTVSNEGTIENMIKTKGFPDCVVFINNGIVNVVVTPKSGDLLSDSDVQQIEEVVVAQANVAPENIRIIAAQ